MCAQPLTADKTQQTIKYFVIQCGTRTAVMPGVNDGAVVAGVAWYMTPAYSRPGIKELIYVRYVATGIVGKATKRHNAPCRNSRHPDSNWRGY